MNKEKIIALVGGGTGGHIFPLVALGEELTNRKIDFVYIGSPNSLESEVIRALKWQFLEIGAGKWRRYISLASIIQNFLGLFVTVRGIIQSVRIIRRHNIGLIFSKGGYVSLPVLYAARVVGCPVIIHESDSIMGTANRVGSKFAKRILTAFDPSVFPHSDARYRKVGIPVRKSLRQAASLRSPKKERPLILIIPGSQGSGAINQYLKQELRSLLKKYDIIHLAGKKDFSYFESLRKRLPKIMTDRYRTYSFIDRELPYYYQSANLVIVRGSATTAAEAALFAKPIYIIPIPDSANNHQSQNARILESVGAAFVRQQYQLSGEKFVKDINRLLRNENNLRTMGGKLFKYFSSSNSIENIIKEIEDVIDR